MNQVMALPGYDSQWDLAFRASPFRLRFQLGGPTFDSDSPVPRFIQAFGRARQLALEAFEQSRQVCGIVASGPHWANDEMLEPAEDGFQALQAAGFSAALLQEWEAPLWPEDDEDERISARWRAFDLGENLLARDVLLWCCVASEMAVSPKASVVSSLVDFERGILLHVYDDRGMDLTALRPETLLSLYRSRSEWLLDYDRERMRRAFE